MSLGSSRVRLNFNPGANSMVEAIKLATARLIDVCEAMKEGKSGETIRLCAEAQTAYETAAMYAVKAATTGAENVATPDGPAGPTATQAEGTPGTVAGSEGWPAGQAAGPEIPVDPSGYVAGVGQLADSQGLLTDPDPSGQPVAATDGQPDAGRRCGYAKSDMTPCVVKDGSVAYSDGGRCVGCGRTPAATGVPCPS